MTRPDAERAAQEESTRVPALDHPAAGWLWNFTDPEREVCKQPFTVQWNGAPHTLATNGHIMVLTPELFGCDAPLNEQPYQQVFATFPTGPECEFPITEVRKAIGLSEPEAVRPDCDKCANTGKTECDECDGDGDMECECSCGDCHTTACDECDGNGNLPCDCAWAVGQPLTITPVRIGRWRYNLAYLRRVLVHMPDSPATWQEGAYEGRSNILRVGPWAVVIQGVRETDAAPVLEFDLGAPKSSRAAAVAGL